MKRENPFFMGLRFKLAISILLTVLVSMSVLSLMLLKMTRVELLGQALGRASQLSRSIESVIKLQWETNSDFRKSKPSPSLQRILLLFYEEEQLGGLALYDMNREEIARQGQGFELPRSGWMEVADGEEYQLLQQDGAGLLYRSTFTRAHLPLSVAILFPMEKINQVIAFSQIKTIFLLSFSSFVIFIFLLFVITVMVINPLKTLNRSIDRISDGNLDHRVELLSRDEVGFVAESFNTMVSTLRENRDTIEKQIEELKKAHRETLAAQSDLIAAEKMASLGTLAAGVAHEVGNPLGAVIGYINLLGKGNMSREEHEDCLNRSASELNRIHQIMLEMLDYARTTREESSVLNVGAILTRLVADLEREGALEHLKVSLDLEGDLPRVMGFPHKMEQVFTNLIKNAVWATDSAGRLEITARTQAAGEGERKERHLVLAFTDNGRGIPEENIGRIFDPFFTTRMGQGGTGLGLAISNRIVEEMGGSFTVTSEPGKTSFIIRFSV